MPPPQKTHTNTQLFLGPPPPPQQVALACGSVAAGWYMRHTGKFYYMTAFMCLLSLLSMILLSTWGPDTPEWLLWVAVAPSGFGLAGTLTSTLVALIGSVDKADIACSTGSEWAGLGAELMTTLG